MAKFDKSFFEGEIRNGFYIEPMVKRAWAAGIEVLEEIGKVCKRHNIQYFADWGTLLGAVRHQGFIPWDDDIDIGMKREDLRKFLAVAQKELPEEYLLLNVHTEKNHTRLITRVVNSRYMNWGPERMEKYHDFPYVVGIDIFTIDYVPRVKEDEQLQCQLVSIVCNTINNMIIDPPVEPQIIDAINHIQAICGVQFHQNSSIKNQLACLADNLCGLYTEADGDKLSQIPDLANGWDYYVDKASYEDIIMMPFETIQIPVPAGYDQILRIKYGEFYMSPINRGSSHEYPFYKKQEFDMLSRLALHRKEHGIHYKVVFMPYKASMWDSLESIWRACKADDTCECKVVPIPYYTYDKEKNEVTYCYEGADFPVEVEIVDYKEYHLEQELPHVIYIHNPYDDCNRTTSVSPTYFSKELKKYTHKLVYVPYYVTTGTVSPEHLNLPVYQNMDHMIVQSRRYKDGFLGLKHYHKMLDLGSPKLDRVIRMTQEGVTAPEEWGVDLTGKKAILLNTSVNCFLTDGELYLNKIKIVLATLKKYEDVVLIWRPHPLLRATLISMRPQLVETYDMLVEEFKSQKLGIWDETPDITRVAAVADAYIGDAGTSIINLFGVANKPIFILNNFIRQEFTEEEKCELPIVDMCTVGDEQWILSEYNGIYVKDKDWSEIRCKEDMDFIYRWRGAPYFSMLKAGERIYLAPYTTIYFAYIDVKEKKLVKLPLSPIVSKWLHVRKMVSYGDKLFCLLQNAESILEYDTITMKWSKHVAGIKVLKTCAKERIYEDALDCVTDGQYLWVVAAYTNTLLRLDMETAEHVLVPVGEKGYGYSGILDDGECLWLAEIHTGALVVWNKKTNEVTIHHMPEDFCCWKRLYGRYLAHKKLLSNENYIFTIPGFANSMVRVDKNTGECRCIHMDFLKRENPVSNGFHAQYVPGIKYAGWYDETTIWIQRAWDHTLAFIDVESNIIQEVHPALSKDEMETMVSNKDIFIDKDGFEGHGGTSMYYRGESRHFSLEGFLNDLCGGRLEHMKERQSQVMSGLAANLDGTCGEKVHQYIMGEFDREIFKITDYV